MDPLMSAGLLEFENQPNQPKTWNYKVIPDRDADGNDVIYD